MCCSCRCTDWCPTGTGAACVLPAVWAPRVSQHFLPLSPASKILISLLPPGSKYFPFYVQPLPAQITKKSSLLLLWSFSYKYFSLTHINVAVHWAYSFYSCLLKFYSKNIFARFHKTRSIQYSVQPRPAAGSTVYCNASHISHPWCVLGQARWQSAGHLQSSTNMSL